MRIHARFLAQQREGAQEGQPAPCPAPLPAFSCFDFPVSTSILSLCSQPCSLCVGLTHSSSLLCWLSANPQPLPSLSLSHFFFPSSCPAPPTSPTSLNSPSACPASAALQPKPSSSPLPPQSPLSGPGGQSDCKEGWQGEMSDSESESLL